MKDQKNRHLRGHQSQLVSKFYCKEWDWLIGNDFSFCWTKAATFFFLLRPSSVLATFFQALYGEGTPWNSVFTVSLVFSTLSTSSPFNTAEERCLLTPLQIWHERYETAPWRSSCTTCAFKSTNCNDVLLSKPSCYFERLSAGRPAYCIWLWGKHLDLRRLLLYSVKLHHHV